MPNLKELLIIFSLVVVLTPPAHAQFGNGFGQGGNNAGGNGNGNAHGHGRGRGRGNGHGPGGNGNGNNGNGNGNGGPAGVPLPLLGGTVLGHAALLSGGYLAWRRRKTRSKTAKQIKSSNAS